jgi:hypothetical protein
MSRIQLNIDHLVLNGFAPAEAQVLAEALREQLAHVLANPASRAEWAHPHRTPVLKLGSMPLQAGTTGASKFGTQVANAVGRGLMR